MSLERDSEWERTPHSGAPAIEALWAQLLVSHLVS